MQVMSSPELCWHATKRGGNFGTGDMIAIRDTSKQQVDFQKSSNFSFWSVVKIYSFAKYSDTLGHRVRTQSLEKSI